MSVSLVKGGNVSLTKESGGNLSSVTVGLGWDVRTTTGVQFDLDASALSCGKNGKVLSDQHFVFYNNKQSPDGAIVYGGDNRTGAGDGDDEQIFVKLQQLPANVEKVVIVVSIHLADVRGQNFGQVENAFIRIVDDTTGTELARFDLGEDFSAQTAVIFGEVYRYSGEWKFRAIGQGYSTGLAGVAVNFGVNVD